MVAIQHPDILSGQDYRPGGSVRSYAQPGFPGRPRLRVIEGGRATARQRAVYRRRRIVVAAGLVLALVVLAPVLVSGASAVGRAYGLGPAPVVRVAPPADGPIVIAQPGDTLWSIARRLQPTGDIIPLVDRLAALHGPGVLLAGDRIDVTPLLATR